MIPNTSTFIMVYAIISSSINNYNPLVIIYKRNRPYPNLLSVSKNTLQTENKLTSTCKNFRSPQTLSFVHFEQSTHDSHCNFCNIIYMTT